MRPSKSLRKPLLLALGGALGLLATSLLIAGPAWAVADTAPRQPPTAAEIERSTARFLARRLFNGFSLFCRLDSPLMRPESVLALEPEPDFCSTSSVAARWSGCG